MKGVGWRTWLLVGLIYLTVYVVFLSETWLTRAIDTERNYNREFFSEPVAAHAEQRANGWFSGVFVDTGVMATSFDLFIPSAEERALQPRGFDGAGDGLFTWFEGRLRAMWTVVWAASLRISTGMLWWPYLLFVVVPFVVDGLVKRKVRQHTFALSSPLQHRYALWAMEFAVIGGLLVLFLPLPMHPGLLPLMALGVGVAGQYAAANFMKRV